MEIVSYLLGKKSSGGGGGGGSRDWSVIGYTGEPEYIDGAVNQAKAIYDNWDSSITSMNLKYKDTDIIYFPLVDTSNVTSFQSCFNGCYNLQYMPKINTSKALNLSYMFMNCKVLISIPLLDTKNVSNMSYMFSGCTILRDLPLLNTSIVTDMSGMLTNCSHLSDTSLDNLLQMCINATSYTNTKTLKAIGLNYLYEYSRVQALPHYQEFVNAGWTIGY